MTVPVLVVSCMTAVMHRTPLPFDSLMAGNIVILRVGRNPLFSGKPRPEVALADFRGPEVVERVDLVAAAG